MERFWRERWCRWGERVNVGLVEGLEGEKVGG